jgi:hypothetical protein
MRYARGSPLGLAFWVLAFAAGSAAALAPITWPGLVLGGSACGGGGSEQVCRGIARELTLVEVSAQAWLWVAAGAAVAGIAVAGLLVANDSWRLGAAAFALVLALAGVATTSEIDARLGPEGGGTWGRADEQWGSFLRPALLDFRADAVRALEGERERPGAPAFEREQILASFSVRARFGWKLLRASGVVLLFAAAFETARRLLRNPFTGAVAALTGGGLAWAILEDRATVCDPGASDCHQGMLTFLAFVAAALVWAVYAIGVLAVRAMRPRPPRPPA